MEVEPHDSRRSADIESLQRTQLAAERTWLAWWRSGIATAIAALGVGGLIPSVIDADRDLYIALGIGYALLSLAIFFAAYRRQASVEKQIAAQQSVSLNPRVVLALSLAGALLSLATVITLLAGS